MRKCTQNAHMPQQTTWQDQQKAATHTAQKKKPTHSELESSLLLPSKKNNSLSPSQMDSAKIRLCKCFAHSSCWATFPVGELLLVGPMVVVLTSTLGSAHFPEHLRLVSPAWAADVDLSVHFYTSVAPFAHAACSTSK